ncbi:MAG: GDP-mannose 4,6-dehydratase [Candidatus Bathyarchaeales archaeon]
METIEKKSILVTGGAGFIGHHLCRKLLEKDVNLTIYDNLSTGRIENVKDLPKPVKFVKGDVGNLETLENSVRQVDVIFHLAAQVSVPYSMENPVEDFKSNAYGTLNILELARKKDARVVYTSSAAVYGKPAKLPTPEDSPLKPISFYGLSKLVGEKYCNTYIEKYGLDASIMRIANAYGPRCHGVIADYITKIRKNPNKLEIIGSGMQSRDFVHVSDVVEALILLATSKEALGQTFNVGFGKTMTVVDLAKILLKMLKLEETVVTTTSKSWEGDLDIIWLDISKAREKLKWTPKTSIEEGLKNLINAERLL